MHLPELPDEIDWEDANRAIESLGIPINRLRSITYTPGQIEVSYFRTTADDLPMKAHDHEDGLSMVKTTIRVKSPKVAN